MAHPNYERIKLEKALYSRPATPSYDILTEACTVAQAADKRAERIATIKATISRIHTRMARTDISAQLYREGKTFLAKFEAELAELEADQLPLCSECGEWSGFKVAHKDTDYCESCIDYFRYVD